MHFAPDEGIVDKAAALAAANRVNGEPQTVALSFPVADLASYDYADSNGNGSKTYEADSGTYTVYIGKNANDT